MPLIDVLCATGHVTEVMRAIADWPKTPPCPLCGAMTEQTLRPKTISWSCDPVVVYRAPDGTFRFPGDPHSAATRKYDQQGYTRIEMRSAADVRRFESQMNTRELSSAGRRLEAKQAQRESRQSQTRAELRRLMPRMTPQGQAVARAAMARTDAKPKDRVKDANFHVEVFSYDRSNRDASRDSHGRRRRD